MRDYAAEVDALKERLAAAQRARTTAEHRLDAARAQAQTERDRLSREFGVSGVEEAIALREQLQAELAAALTELTQALDEIGA